MNRLLIILLFTLPIGIVTSSCSDDDDVQKAYEAVIKEKIDMFNSFKQEYADRYWAIIQIGNDDLVFAIENLEIKENRYLVATYEDKILTLDIIHLVGYGERDRKASTINAILYFSN